MNCKFILVYNGLEFSLAVYLREAHVQCNFVDSTAHCFSGCDAIFESCISCGYYSEGQTTICTECLEDWHFPTTDGCCGGWLWLLLSNKEE